MDRRCWIKSQELQVADYLCAHRIFIVDQNGCRELFRLPFIILGIRVLVGTDRKQNGRNKPEYCRLGFGRIEEERSMSIQEIISAAVAEFLGSTYNHEVDASSVQIDKTRKEFEGDYTVVVFPFVRVMKNSPEKAGEELG